MKNYIIAFLVITIFVVIYAFEKTQKITYVPIGIHEVTTYKATKAECGNFKGWGFYGKRVAINGHPKGNFFANNFLPQGTRVIIPSISGSKVWILEDKLKDYVNGVYIGNRFDLLVDLDSYRVGRGVRKAEVFILVKGEK